MADVHDLVNTIGTYFGCCGAILHDGKHGILHRLESLRDQRRADGTGRIAAAERDHAPAKLRWDGRGRQQITREVDDVLEIVAMSKTGNRETGDGAAFFLVEPDWPANSRRHAGERRDADAVNAIHEICFDEAVCGVGKSAIAVRADIKSGVRPGRLRQIFDRRADLRIALNQQHVPGLEAGEQPIRWSGRRSPVDMALPAQKARKGTTDLFRYAAQRASTLFLKNLTTAFGYMESSFERDVSLRLG